MELLRKIPQELDPRFMQVEDLLGQTIPIQIGPATNKKILLTPHPWVNPERLYRVLSMTHEQFLLASKTDPMTCWIIDQEEQGSLTKRMIVLATGNHRAAVYYLRKPAMLEVTGIAKYSGDKKLLHNDGKFNQRLPLYPFNMFLSDIRAHISKLI